MLKWMKNTQSIWYFLCILVLLAGLMSSYTLQSAEVNTLGDKVTTLEVHTQNMDVNLAKHNTTMSLILYRLGEIEKKIDDISSKLDNK